MFSYLRPHHRRTPSNPSSPAEQSHSYEPPLHPNASLDHGHPRRYQDGNLSEAQLTNNPPPSLPPIARVSTAESDFDNSRRRGYEKEVRIGHWNALRNSTHPKDTNTYSHHQISPYLGGAHKPEFEGVAAPANYPSSQYSKHQSGLNQDTNSRTGNTEPKRPSGNTADSQRQPVQAGRRPTGARLPPPPSSGPNQVSTFEPVQHKSGKARLNLLNPMSLLARRRTAQAVPQPSPEALAASRNASTFSETFDPRIKGKFVHDFSAPRAPKRNVSYNDVRARENGDVSRQFQGSPNHQHGDSTDDQTSPWSGGNHTPVFTENFEDEQYPAAGPHVRRASDLADLPLPKLPYAHGASKPLQKLVESSTNSKSNDIQQNQFTYKKTTNDQRPVPNIGSPVPLKAEGSAPVATTRISIDLASTPPKSSASSRKGRSRNVSEVSARDGMPKHMKSNSSRFSFDMIGAAEQERLLEDRHRQRALEKKSETVDRDGRDDDYEDDFDYDNMMDDDGLEERIPGVNADLEDEDCDNGGEYEEPIPGVNRDLDEEDYEEEIPDGNQNIGGFTFQRSGMVSPLSPNSPGFAVTPRDADGNVIGFAMTKNSPNIHQGAMLHEVLPLSASNSPDNDTSSVDEDIQGLGLQGIDMNHSVGPSLQPSPEKEAEAIKFPQPDGLDDDDLYFDDGIIGGPGDEEDAIEFDESVFDNIDTDEYGRPLKSLSSLPTLYSPPMLTTEPSPSFDKIVETKTTEPKDDEYFSPMANAPIRALAPQPSIISHIHPQPSTTELPAPTFGLTQDTLAAYQSALALAAHQAAASGKFRRESTHPSESDQEPQPGLIADSSQTSHYEPFSPSYELEDAFDYDDAAEDDAIIAAANAEALANDCDGFYGQEFGFYSAPAIGETEYANGGYFGPRGPEGINRSTSGRVVSREPNLTPITERSEYSNRNSFMSLSLNMHRPDSLTSPGLVQLAGMMREEDYAGGDMSLDALLKLRRGAWGGSQASLHSSNGGSPKSAGVGDGSPVGGIPPWSNLGSSVADAGGQGQVTAYKRRNSGLSGASGISEVSMSVGLGKINSTGTAMEIGPVSEDGSAPESSTRSMASPVGDIIKGGSGDSQGQLKIMR